MNQLKWAEEESQAVLRAMATVATDAGESELDGIGRQMLLATRDFILKASGEIPEGELISPSQLAEALPGPEKRRQVTEFLVLMPFLPMKVSAARVAQVEAFAEALGVRCDTLRDLRLVCDGRLGRWAVSYGRRTLAAYQPSGAFAQLKLAASALTQFVGNKKVAARYSALQALPEGTLGRTFYDFYRDRSFPLPGEKKSFTELTVSHDLTHILAGYNTDKSGEGESGWNRGRHEPDGPRLRNAPRGDFAIPHGGESHRRGSRRVRQGPLPPRAGHASGETRLSVEDRPHWWLGLLAGHGGDRGILASALRN